MPDPILRKGVLRKMRAVEAAPISYGLPVGESEVAVSDWIGQPFFLTFSGRIFCLGCGWQTSKSYSQGYCYPCFLESPETAECIVRPELCRAHEGIGRDVEWERQHHLQPHVVYLAVSSGLKVGVTRATQVPTRWIDQGATQAMVIARTPNRYLAGCIEVALKSLFSDRTIWQKMLKGEAAPVDLEAERLRAREFVSSELARYFVGDLPRELVYPLQTVPAKLKSISVEGASRVGGVLLGIKGQYLVFEGGEVLNIRRYGGYEVSGDEG